jgi:hypothetical protein
MRIRWRALMDCAAATLFLMVMALLWWTLFGIRMHRIPLSRGAVGDYGIIELPGLIGADTEIIEFSAIRVPSRVIAIGSWLRWPVPEVLEVAIRVRQSDSDVVEYWECTYLLACDADGGCKPMSTLRGIILYGLGENGAFVDREWRYFQEARPLQEKAVPSPALPPNAPEPIPPPPPDRPFPRFMPRELRVSIPRLFTGGDLSFSSVR